MKSDVFETKTVQIWLDADGILWVRLLPGVVLTLPEAEKNTAIMQELAGGKKRPVLTDMRQIGGITREARQFSAGEAVQKVNLALAMHVNSPFTRSLGNLWLGINKPPFPSKMFSRAEEAVVWLKGFLD
jgi:hypothetical protein